MQPTVGEIFEGKVTGITKFGAFVSLPDGNNGLVHISEIANTYVNDVHEHITEGQMVKVKVIGINEAGKINLSIKKAEPPAPRPEFARPAPQSSNYQRPHNFTPRSGGFAPKPAPPSTPEAVFEDKLKQFMQDSDSRISDSRMYADKKGGYRKKR
ncbi:MAG: S1 RNA-binding domain-containing protein, partial [Oscillospiraceae bacterium]